VRNRQEFRQSKRYARLCHSLGDAFTDKERSAEAIDLYREATHYGPENPLVLNNLAHHLLQTAATNNDAVAEAVRLTEKAAALTHRDIPAVLDTLARAQAASGQRPAAIATAREAMQKARAQKDEALAGTLQTLIEEWRKALQ
jgi:Flp pilus assembly protein TadD